MLRRKLSPYKAIALVYLLIIVVGALLLTLPIASASGNWTDFLNALFTATSATAVTGLVVVDTALHWSIFGQIVILLLIQVGGMGIMTIVSLLHLFISKQMSLYESNVLMQSAGALTHSDVVKITKRVLVITVISEVIGAVVLTLAFLKDMTFGQALYNGIFHSISAFCNAGFDILGTANNAFASFESYSNNWIVNITLMLLITSGGLGFIVWNDIIENKHRVTKYKLHSKIVLIANTALVFGGALLFFAFEYNNSATMQNYSFGHKMLASFFQSVTCRTAGFNTINIGQLTESSKMLSMVLMMIGGGAGSTAGGIKITTFVIILVGISAVARSKKDVNVMSKRMPDGLIRQALIISSVWLILTFVSAMIICVADNVTLTQALFESFSALGTVGLSLGITPQLGWISRLVLQILMFVGRVGIATLAVAFVSKKNTEGQIRKPLDNILIG